MQNYSLHEEPARGYYNRKTLKRAYDIINTLDNGPRRKIIELLDDRGEMSVLDIMITLRNPKWDQPVISQHLGRLRKHMLVNLRTDGKFHYYSVNYDMIERVIAFVNGINNFTPVKKA